MGGDTVVQENLVYKKAMDIRLRIYVNIWTVFLS